MKKALALLSLALTLGISGVGVSPMVETAALEDPAVNAYTIIDTKRENLAYERLCTDGYLTGPNEEFSYSKTIIGFDTPNVDFQSINRLTIKVKYYTYHFMDVFHWNPISNEKTWIIRSTDIVVPALEPRINGDDWKGWSLGEGFGSIGFVPDLVAFEEFEPYGFIAASTNVTNTWESKFIRDTDLFLKEHYVVLPVSQTFDEVWISLDGVTVDDVHISDGLNDAGEALSDELGTFIGFEAGVTVRSCSFNSVSTITMIAVESLVGDVSVDFGVYSYEVDKWMLVDFRFDFTESADLEVGLEVQYDHQAIVTFSEGSSGIVKIYYEADVPATHNDIIDPDGHIRPTTVDPEPSTGEGDGNGNLWLIIGCVLGLLGVAVLIYYLSALFERFAGSAESIQRSKYFRSKRKYHR